MRNKVWTQSSAFLATLALVAGCSQPLTTREKGVLAGGGLGAATGAIIGAAAGNPGAGAAIGGALGGAAGGLISDQLQQREQVTTEQQREIEQQLQELARNRQLLEELKRQNLEARETDRGGVVVNLPDVLFEFGRAELTSEARVKVRDIADVLNDRARDRRVAVEGHTDSIDSATFNQELSERRAENVVIALENSGVTSGRITAQGYGKRYPVAPNTNPDGTDNPAGRAKNRRVEVVIQN